MNFTPGPWDARPFDNGYVRATDDSILCVVDGLEDRNLIAAAPEMYEALEECVRLLASRTERSISEDYALAAGNAALAKARGEVAR